MGSSDRDLEIIRHGEDIAWQDGQVQLEILKEQNLEILVKTIFKIKNLTDELNGVFDDWRD